MDIKLRNILRYSIQQLFFLNEILNPYELQDIKWQILFLSPEITEAFSTWSFATKYLTRIIGMMGSPTLILTPIENSMDFKKENNIAIFEKSSNFINTTEFLNFFDIFVYAHAIYFTILRNIHNKFRNQFPNKRIYFEFSNIMEIIRKFNGKYVILYHIFNIPQIGISNTSNTNKIIELIITIKTSEPLPKEFIGTFNRIKKYLDTNNNPTNKNPLEYIINYIMNDQLSCRELSNLVTVTLK